MYPYGADSGTAPLLARCRKTARGPCPMLTNKMNSSLILVMGRIAGVTAAETRERLLRAAADVFARRGYDGTRVADIAVAADVSSGALYAHFGSKAELLVAALRSARAATARRGARRRSRPADHGSAAAHRPAAPSPSRRPRLPHRRGAGRRPPRRGRCPADARLRRRTRRLARRTRAHGPGRWRARPVAVAERAGPLLPPARDGQRAHHTGPPCGRRRGVGRVAHAGGRRPRPGRRHRPDRAAQTGTERTAQTGAAQ